MEDTGFVPQNPTGPCTISLCDPNREEQIFFYPSGFFWLDKELNQHKADLRGGHQSLKTCIYRRLSNKESVCSAGDARDQSSIPGSGRSPGGGHDNPLQHFHLENPMGRGAWRSTVHRITESQTWLKPLSTHTHRRDSWKLRKLPKRLKSSP